MKQENKQRSFSTVASLVMLAVFAVGILGVLLTGAQAYRRLTQLGQQSYDSRTGCSYIASRFRQAAPDVRIEPFGDGDALAFYEELDGKSYVTRIYCYDGWLMELFCGAAGDLGPETGEKILPVRTLELEQQDMLVTAVLTDGNGNTSRLALHSPVEVVP